ncbi:MAG: DUF349 domain-containing protein [Ideonella sp.]
MLRWIFKKKAPAADAPPRASSTQVAAVAAGKAIPAAAVEIDWAAKLREASGDDNSLLMLACSGVPLDVKLAAVGALNGEETLKLAEREFRNRDRRVHRLAKQAYLARVAQRETRERADHLIKAARTLGDQSVVPANRALELDRAWMALDPSLLDAGQHAEFATLTQRLTTLSRELADHEAMVQRWHADARQALQTLQAASQAAAEGEQDRSQLAAAMAAACGLVEAAPQDCAVDALDKALAGATALDTHLAILDRVLQTAQAHEPADHATPLINGDETNAAQDRVDAVAQWMQLAALPDARLGELLNRRFEQWQRAQTEEKQAVAAQRREQVAGRQQAARGERSAGLVAALEHAEAALATGKLADAHRHLSELDERLHGIEPVEAMRGRISAVQAQYAQLRGWQHWAGGRARDELILQAEALAAAGRGEVELGIPALSIKQQAEVVEEMRARWKELDRSGGASRALWQRFDGALKAAYEPVAAHRAAQSAAREQNLMARQQLIETLDAVPLPVSDEQGSMPDMRSLAVALDQFRAEWRKLGPLEHAVPQKERGKLAERMDNAVRRIEAPLDEARRAAQLEREDLITRAEALGAEAAADVQRRDLVNEVRALQQQWQQQARSLPLARAIEKAMWAQFKVAIDAVFSAREAAFDARDAEFKANSAERSAIIAGLEALVDAPPAECKHRLAEIETAWLRAGPAPRSESAALQAQFDSMRDKLRQWLAGSAQRSWHSTCDALVAKLTLCEALERSTDADRATGTAMQRWSTLPVLPGTWERALLQRAGLGESAAGALLLPTETTDNLLLQLETAWGLASPAAFEAARRELKLQALKAAMEGRRAGSAASPGPNQFLTAALERSSLDPSQRERLGAVIDTLRQRGPIDPDLT